MAGTDVLNCCTVHFVLVQLNCLQIKLQLLFYEYKFKTGDIIGICLYFCQESPGRNDLRASTAKVLFGVSGRQA